MPNFILFTKTLWGEPPRLRHQVASLLANAGHEVIFVQKPALPWQMRKPTFTANDRIRITMCRELIHHKLRLAPLIHQANAALSARSIRSHITSSGTGARAVILNFNYDYYFLRRVFPDNKIFTFINDDHLATALFRYEKPLRWALEKTCAFSDRILAVSSSLQDELSSYGPTDLFLPWTDVPYRRPRETARNILLYWGYINDRLDTGLLMHFADYLKRSHPNLRIMLVGPIERGLGRKFTKLFSNGVIEISPPAALDSIELDSVLAGLIPYRFRRKIDAAELPNKALQILARGLPLIISGMPNFVEQPFIFRIRRSKDSYETSIATVIKQFFELQPDIKTFVSMHTPEKRLAQLIRLSGE